MSPCGGSASQDAAGACRTQRDRRSLWKPDQGSDTEAVVRASVTRKSGDGFLLTTFFFFFFLIQGMI